MTMPTTPKTKLNKSTESNSKKKNPPPPFIQITEDGMGLPEFQDLCDGLRFSPTEGRIWLSGQRMLMSNTTSWATLRRELIETLGLDKARGIFTRIGYTAGYRDAETAAKLRKGGDAYDVLTAGPALHAIEGWASVEPIKLDIDVAQGHYYGEFIWRNSAEADIHGMHYGHSTDPVCWTQIGYATGYGSRFMGKRLLYKEIECSGMGHSRCMIIGKPVEQWDDPTPEISYMYPDQQGNKMDLRPTHHLPRTFPADTLAPSRLTSFGGMIGASSGFTSCCNMLQRVANTTASVIFLGETGVGKERFARALHAVSDRADGPFVAINCAAIPPDLIEAELFGVMRGAFTGATTSRAGRFERADGGSIFLDEVGTLSLAAQGKLLRVLQEHEFERVGDEQTRKVDTRVIAATNANLREDIKAGKFREDLWFRINVFPIEIPPLRKRRDDIPLLLEYFLKTYNVLHKRSVTGYTERALDALLNYQYPGNIRELENMVERAVILAPKDSALDITHIFSQGEHLTNAFLGMSADGHLQPNPDYAPNEEDGCEEKQHSIADQILSGGATLGEIESELVLKAVQLTKGNLAEAARLIGMTRRQLEYRFSKLDEKVST